VKLRLALLAPVLAGLLGWAWMTAAARHFEAQTGRDFYRLAGYSYTVPRDGFAYYEDGPRIEFWTLSVPGAATFITIGVLLLLFVFQFRRKGLALLAAGFLSHAAVAAGYLVVFGWFALNVLGVFL
jgi:hypothetical protein